MAREDRIVVGSIAGAFGVHGEVRLKSFCAEPEAIADYAPLHTEDGRSFALVVLTGRTKGGLTARLDGVVTKEEADALRGTRLLAAREVMPRLPDDEYYYADLVGLTVSDTGGRDLGTVGNVMDHGAGELLEVTLKGGGEPVLVPFTRAIVPNVDLAAGRIVIDPPEGLFPAD